MKCSSAPEKTFVTREELLAHYKTEWHAYNIRRKTKNLPAVTEAVFNQVKLQLEQQKLLKQGKKQDHIKFKKSNQPLSNFEKVDSKYHESKQGSFQIDIEEAEKDVDYCQSLFEFDEKPLTFHSIDANLNYMQKHYGFFIPDKEYLTDLKGLLRYCSHKIRVAKLCLFCDKRFPSNNAVIQHMKSKNHCKLNSDLISVDDEVYNEFEEFYKYPDEIENQKQCEMELFETGEILLKYKTKENKIIGNKNYKNYYNQFIRSGKDDSLALKLNSKEERERLKKLISNSNDPKAKHELTLSHNLFHLMSKLEKRTRKRVENKQQFKQNKLKLRDGEKQNLILVNKTVEKLECC